MLRETYWLTASSASRLASAPLAPPPTPSATIMRSASRWLSAMRLSGTGQAGLLHDHLFSEGADEEVVLILGADLPGVGEPVDVDLVVPGLPVGRGRRSGLGRRSWWTSCSGEAECPNLRREARGCQRPADSPDLGRRRPSADAVAEPVYGPASRPAGALPATSAAQERGCDPQQPFGPSRDLYCVELLAAPGLPGVTGRVELSRDAGPFTVEVGRTAARGHD